MSQGNPQQPSIRLANTQQPSIRLESFAIPGGGYNYTALPVGDLMCPDNTVAAGLFDESGSTAKFATPMEKCVQEIIKSLRHSPRADNLVYGQWHFGTGFRELHGFTPLPMLNLQQYDGCYQPGGLTNLYDAEVKVAKFVRDYCHKKMQMKYMCNAFIYTLTDGGDTGSICTEQTVRDEFQAIISGEEAESLMSILIGVNLSKPDQDRLTDHAQKVGYSQFINIDKATESALAQVANFISHSLSSQSASLGTGGPSKPIAPPAGMQSVTF